MRLNFPTLRLNKDCIYLDNAATSLKLSSVIKKVDFFTKKFPLNSHSNSSSEEHLIIKETIHETRKLIANWINAKEDEISFVPSTTHALNFLALSFDSLLFGGGLSIAITKAEHSSNSYPWIDLGKRNNVKINYLPLNDQFSIDEEKLSESVDSSTFLVSFAHISNSFGSLNNIKRIAGIIKSINPNCYIVVDACQSISHALIDVDDWGIDALVFSSHKLYGPDGIAVLWVKKELENKLPHLLWGGGKKTSPLSLSTSLNKSYEKFEVGTISASHIAGLGEVFRFLSKINWKNLVVKQRKLREHTVKLLSKIKGIRIYNSKAQSNILLFNVNNFHSQDICSYLAKNKIFVRSGDFCSPFIKDQIGRDSAVRISLAIYNKKKEIDILVNRLQELEIINCLE